MLNLRRPNRTRSGNNIFIDRRSVAALEFALVAPLLVALFFAVYDVSEAMITYEEVFNAARTIASSVSNISVQTSTSSTTGAPTKLYYGQIQLEASAIFAQMPALRNGFLQGNASVTISSVNFEPTPSTCQPDINGSTCSYNAYVVWSVAYAGPPAGVGTFTNFTQVLRNCATQTPTYGAGTLNSSSALNQVGPTSGLSSDLTTIRTSLVTNSDRYSGPDPIIIVDVNYTYSPLFKIFLKNAVSFWANGYWPVRSVTASQVSGNTFTLVSSDQQYTTLVSTGSTGGPYTITAANVYPPGATATGTAPPTTNYCISPYYAEPQT